MKCGITEYGDPVFDRSWEKWALVKREPTILITKDLLKLLEIYPSILNQENIIVHTTITGYGSTFIEPDVPNPQKIIEVIKKIEQKDRLVIRIDPIIPLPDFVQQSKQIYNIVKSLGFKRIRISILDLYNHVIERLEKDGHFELLHRLKQAYRWDPTLTHFHTMHAPLDLRLEVINNFPFTEICGEPGIECTGCITEIDLKLMNAKLEENVDKCDQREFCQCLGIKKQLVASKTCQHNCIYCYMKGEADVRAPII